MLPCLKLDPDLDRLMATSRDESRLRWAWLAWRDGTGKRMSDDYEKMVKLLNRAAVKNGYCGVITLRASTEYGVIRDQWTVN